MNLNLEKQHKDIQNTGGTLKGVSRNYGMLFMHCKNDFDSYTVKFFEPKKGKMLLARIVKHKFQKL
jgi:hypothetical protein